MAERMPNPVFEVVPEEFFQVKIADLGNACWTVKISYKFKEKIRIFSLFSINILLKIFKLDNIVHLKLFSVQVMMHQLISGVLLVWPLN